MRVVFIILPLLFLLTGCPKDLELEVCIHRVADGVSDGFYCYDSRLPEDRRSYHRDQNGADTDKYICTNETDFRTLQEACEVKEGGKR